jgi:hypothetical protein
VHSSTHPQAPASHERPSPQACTCHVPQPSEPETHVSTSSESAHWTSPGVHSLVQLHPPEAQLCPAPQVAHVAPPTPHAPEDDPSTHVSPSQHP